MMTNTKTYADIVNELAARVDELTPVVEEYVRLAEALVALREAENGNETVAVLSPTRAPAAKRRPAKRKPAAKRAPRGANKAAILAALSERPGATAGEIAQATGIGKQVVYSALNAAVKRNEVVAVDLPTGLKGYKVAG